MIMMPSCPYFIFIDASISKQARSKLGGVDTSILHHAFISIFFALWAVITRYGTILMAIISYFTRFIMKREKVGSWDSGWKRSKYWKPILHNSKSPAKKVPERAHVVHLLLYEGSYPGKNRGQAYGTKLRRHEAEPWQNQSRAPAELFCRGHFPPGGGNHHHRHHQRSSHRERAISINNLHQHHLISKP